MAIMIDPTQIGYAVTAVISATAGALAATRRLTQPMMEFAREWREFRDDWRGVPDRPGFRGHPGMAERMQKVEERTELIGSELRTNGGGSLKDAVLRVEAQQRLTAVHGGGPVVAPAQVHVVLNGEQAAA